MFKAYKFRLYPTREQEEFLSQHFGCTRFVYNWGLDRCNEIYTKEKKHISTHQLMKELVLLKKDSEYSWLSNVNSQSLQQSLWNLDDSFKRFFKKISNFPTFKSKRDHKQSFSIPQFLKIDFSKSTISIPKLKSGIRIKIHRRIDGSVDCGVISRTPTGKYFISFKVETPDIQPKTSGNVVGIDFGVKTFMTLSTGEKIDRRDFFYKFEDILKRLQRKYSKCKNDSKNKEKLRVRISKIHEKITNQRDDFLHKITSKIVENQDYDFVGIEDLNIVGMMKNRSMSKRIGDLGWNKTTEVLKYKLERVGKRLIKIGRFDPSSKMCSCCGKINHDLKLSDRTWKCSCGKVHDRDQNAATNIKNFAEVILGDVGREPSEFKSVEKLTSDDLRKMIVESTSMNRKKFKDTITSHLEADPSLVGR